MPRGGARVGAGRKPKAPGPATVARRIVPIEGGRAKDVTPTPPSDLPEDQKGFWRNYAGLAIDAGTLTKQTEPAFRLLCELDSEKRLTRETIERDGRTSTDVTTDPTSAAQHVQVKAHPLTSSYRQLAQRVETLMARFSLAPFGKPLAGGKKSTTTVSPWAAIAAAKNGRR